MLSPYVTATALLSISVIARSLALDLDLQDGINLQHINYFAEPTQPPVTPINFTVDFILRQGYPVEVHEVTTADGYILTLHRIPGSPSSRALAHDDKPTRPPVLMHHGLLGCAADWVVLGPQRALGFILADVGYDIWLANARGTTNSKKHATLNTTDRDFWDFSWHEIGSRDLPAEIDYILNVTGKESLTYVGYSMGTTAFWVLGATMPHYIGKIDQMIALAPVAFFEYATGTLFKTFAFLVTNADWVVNMIGTGEFLPTNAFITWAARTFCKDDAWTQRLCKNVMFLLCGFDSTNITESTIATIFEYVPAGTSTKDFLHYAQLIRGAPAFQQYNYGWIGNLIMYGRFTPPPYRLSGVACPVHIFVAENDWVGNEQDVKTLVDLLPDVQSYNIVDRSDFNHLDFVYAGDAYELVYEGVLRILTRDSIASGGDKDISK